MGEMLLVIALHCRMVWRDRFSTSMARAFSKDLQLHRRLWRIGEFSVLLLGERVEILHELFVIEMLLLAFLTKKDIEPVQTNRSNSEEERLGQVS